MPLPFPRAQSVRTRATSLPRPSGYPQDRLEYAQGFRRPFGVFVPPKELAAQLAATGGTVKRAGTPFPGTHVYFPNDGKTHPSLFFLHGSDGGASGWRDSEAIKWAQRGFIVMPYAYFGVPGGPAGLGGVPLDRAFAAMRYLRGTPQAKNEKLAVFGTSRGAEMAVLLASLPDAANLIDAVIAHSPQDRTQASITVQQHGRLDFVRDSMGVQVPAWTYRNRFIPDGSPIALSRFAGPILLTIGTNDEIWPAAGTYALERQLAGRANAQVVRFLGEAHGLSPAAETAATLKRLQLLRSAIGPK